MILYLQFRRCHDLHGSPVFKNLISFQHSRVAEISEYRKMEGTVPEHILKQQLQDKNPHKMENLSYLPTLGDRRLGFIHRKVSRARKNITVNNEKMKMRSEINTKSIERHKQTEDFLSWKRTLPVKRSLLEIRGLQKCLKRKRESTSLNQEQTQLYGIYEGESLTSFRPEIQSVINHMHPRERRLRKVEQMKLEGKATGRLVDYNECLDKFQSLIKDHHRFLQASFAELRETRRSRTRVTTPAYLSRQRDGGAFGGSFKLPPVRRQGFMEDNIQRQKPKEVEHLPLLTSRKVIHGNIDLEPVVPRGNTIVT